MRCPCLSVWAVHSGIGLTNLCKQLHSINRGHVDSPKEVPFWVANSKGFSILGSASLAQEVVPSDEGVEEGAYSKQQLLQMRDSLLLMQESSPSNRSIHSIT